MIKPDTKQVLADAFVELSKTKPLEKITIQNIVDKCGAGRQTFYNHFKDKEELVEYIFVNDEKKSLIECDGNCSLKDRIKLVLDTIKKKRRFYTYAYDAKGQNSLEEVIIRQYINFYSDVVIKKGGEEALDERMKMSIRFFCRGAYTFCKEWMENKYHCSSEEIAEIIVENMPERLKKYFD